MTLDGRNALVTGGGRGIGRAISLALAEDGADVAVNYRRDKDAADEVVAQIQALGRRAVAVGGSVDVLEDVRALADASIAALGPIDILVNNAGIASRGHTVAKTDPEEVERVVRTHAIGPHWLCGLIIPGMRTRPRGDIVFISSAATRGNAAASAPYNMGKHAMESLAFTLAKEERSKGIHVNIVAPRPREDRDGQAIDEGVRPGHRGDGSRRRRTGVCRPEDVANVVRWIVSDGAGYLNGERIYVDGGAQ